MASFADLQADMYGCFSLTKITQTVAINNYFQVLPQLLNWMLDFDLTLICFELKYIIVALNLAYNLNCSVASNTVSHSGLLFM